jgi:hypothetical protein
LGVIGKASLIVLSIVLYKRWKGAIANKEETLRAILQKANKNNLEQVKEYIRDIGTEFFLHEVTLTSHAEAVVKFRLSHEGYNIELLNMIFKDGKVSFSFPSSSKKDYSKVFRYDVESDEVEENVVMKLQRLLRLSLIDFMVNYTKDNLTDSYRAESMYNFNGCPFLVISKGHESLYVDFLSGQSLALIKASAASNQAIEVYTFSEIVNLVKAIKEKAA